MSYVYVPEVNGAREELFYTHEEYAIMMDFVHSSASVEHWVVHVYRGESHIRTEEGMRVDGQWYTLTTMDNEMTMYTYEGSS